ncbi:MAG: polyphosphate kinase 1 [Bacteroidales bacterium]
MSLYLNREISWLSFNNRVLQEAEDVNVPLLERLRFLGIFSNNLDEFFRVRVASTYREMKKIEKEINADGIDNEGKQGKLEKILTLIEQINKIVLSQQQRISANLEAIQKELEHENIYIINEDEINSEQAFFIKDFFQNKIRQNLIPVMLGEHKKFPPIMDSEVYLAVLLTGHDGAESYAILNIPAKEVGRFITLPQKGANKYVMWIDDVMRYCLHDIFALFDYKKIEAYTFKVTRDAEMELDDDISKSLMEKIGEGLKLRKRGLPVRFVYDRDMPESLLKIIAKGIKISKTGNIISGARYHNLRSLMDFPNVGKPEHYYEKLRAIPHSDVNIHESIIKKIKEKDIMLHYPYQDFGNFINFLSEAAIDPDVEEVCITIYRVAKESKVVNALRSAVSNGKKVIVLLELQARFDEEANIHWSEVLQEAGAIVINGIPGLKVHSKLALVRRREGGELINYAYVGTGNFHEGTSKVYADDGLFTCNPMISDDVANAFEFFKHNYRHFEYKNLIVSPFKLRKELSKRLKKEEEIAKSGEKAYCIFKMNSLIDQEMMDKLIEAAEAGVKIDLIIRGICGIYPSISKKAEKNINVISIVDKFLEHSRIFIFGNRGAEDVFIASADWMPRNLDRRIEVVCPILDPSIKKELRTMIDIQLKDNTKARIIDKKMSNSYQRPNVGASVRAQNDFYSYLRNKHHKTMKLYHNNKCSKSRECLSILEQKYSDIEIIDYLNTTTEDSLKILLKKLGLAPVELVRTSETIYKEKYKDNAEKMSDSEWIDAMVENPKLIQRPIVELNGKAVVARPIEELTKLGIKI